MVCVPVRSIIPSLKLGDYLSVQAHKPCSISHLAACLKSNLQNCIQSCGQGARVHSVISRSAVMFTILVNFVVVFIHSKSAYCA